MSLRQFDLNARLFEAVQVADIFPFSGFSPMPRSAARLSAPSEQAPAERAKILLAGGKASIA